MEKTDSRRSNLDETDIELLEAIEADSDRTFDDLANELDISKSAVHYRIEKLKDNNIIKREHADIDSVALGLNMVMFTEVIVEHTSGYAEELGSKLSEIPGVVHVYYVMGDVDFVLVSRVQNRDQMNELLDDIVAIDGVTQTSSRFVMDEIQADGNVIENISDEMVQNIIDYE
ncbi:MAG: Lrp/AsnC family transcriptional regulator [Halobacteriaceae archaeon]